MARGPKTTEHQIRLAKSCLGEMEKQAVLGVLDREFLGMGAEVHEFEVILTAFFERPAICVVNGTAALHLALQACGISRGDEVLVPSFTFVASFQAIAATGAIPVPCDIDPVTYTLDWEDASKRVTAATRAVMPVHYAGGVGDLDGIYSMAHSYGLRVVEDAAHAFGTTTLGRRVGSFGDVACFSFDGIKNITCGEGGCVVSDDDEVLEQVRRYRSLGLLTERNADPTRGVLPKIDVREQGWRYHMSNIMAAIGIQQFHRRGEFADKRRELARAYDRLLGDFETVVSIPNDYEAVVPFMYAVRIDGDYDIPAVRARLHADGIQTGAQYQPNHNYTLFSGRDKPPLPVVTDLYKRLVVLPLHPDLEVEDVEYICERIGEALSATRS
ncbi:MAG: DegT/DnrJ/EryC1/StrS family aminotransferase [Acidimicrobiales bacterium]|nr:DegT/DnrJ/EryC1/StrS family aminotransferase [Acidimicrobiales bacterium]